MALGPGKYDQTATVARITTGAKGIVLMVIGGDKGSGFSVQAPMEIQMNLPQLLRNLADEIEQSGLYG